MPRAPKIIPNLRYDDVKTAIDWLCRAFGFEVHFVAEEPNRGIVHAQLRMGTELIFLGPAVENDKHGLKSPLSLQGQGQMICVALEDVDAHYERAKQAEAVVVTPPYDSRFGARMYTCLDLEGHIWTFGNYWGEPITNESK
jgi:uncharacterized glyoxalase superfamily protein PhnB